MTGASCSEATLGFHEQATPFHLKQDGKYVCSLQRHEDVEKSTAVLRMSLLHAGSHSMLE